MINDINEIYQSNSEYIKAEDIGNNMWTLTIKTTDVKKFDDGSSKLLLTFHEWEKALPLNVTNARSIADLYGNNPNAWINQQIMLFTIMTTYEGQKKLGVRVRAPQAPVQPQVPQQPQRQPGQMQPQANTNMGGYNPAQQSPQRPLNPTPVGAQPFAPLPDDGDQIPF